MQNKHQKKKFLLSGSQPPGRGGGASRLVQKTKFVKGNISGAPLRKINEIDHFATPEGMALPC